MAITKEELHEYLAPLSVDPSPDAKKEFETHVNILFDHWVSHQNKEALEASSNNSDIKTYIDFMEVFYALVFTSKMKYAEKIEYLFMCIDCDCDGDIEFEEVVLGVKSCEAGLSRMRGDNPAPERRIFDLATEWFNQARSISETNTITEDSFVLFCSDPKYPVYRVLSLYAEAEGSVDEDSDIDKEGGGSNENTQQSPENDEESSFGPRTSGDQFMAVKP
eukprot:CAMPEP_0118653756 /NCGR_PEP_ID=MMETSP0785-20121206/12001_1 /TAXON_ID=91992 /ORGANISM="Bolidomonas pacifica, Strain CCMP 1866" /LENGTH=219 /DNA_ID=CAMNT_0006546321 /DNA_START=281 /DNA_END=936 /DNA_ORIENTATION=-